MVIYNPYDINYALGNNGTTDLNNFSQWKVGNGVNWGDSAYRSQYGILITMFNLFINLLKKLVG